MTDKISEAKKILGHIRKQYDNKTDKEYTLDREIKQGAEGMIISNLRARLGFVLRQYR